MIIELCTSFTCRVIPSNLVPSILTEEIWIPFWSQMLGWREAGQKVAQHQSRTVAKIVSFMVMNLWRRCMCIQTDMKKACRIKRTEDKFVSLMIKSLWRRWLYIQTDKKKACRVKRTASKTMKLRVR